MSKSDQLKNIQSQRIRLKLRVPYIFDYESETQTKINTEKSQAVARSIIRAVLNNAWIVGLITGILAIVFTTPFLTH